MSTDGGSPIISQYITCLLKNKKFVILEQIQSILTKILTNNNIYNFIYLLLLFKIQINDK